MSARIVFVFDCVAHAACSGCSSAINAEFASIFFKKEPSAVHDKERPMSLTSNPVLVSRS